MDGIFILGYFLYFGYFDLIVCIYDVDYCVYVNGL